jgi:hypothetical protein
LVKFESYDIISENYYYHETFDPDAYRVKEKLNTGYSDLYGLAKKPEEDVYFTINREYTNSGSYISNGSYKFNYIEIDLNRAKGDEIRSLANDDAVGVTYNPFIYKDFYVGNQSSD